MKTRLTSTSFHRDIVNTLCCWLDVPLCIKVTKQKINSCFSLDSLLLNRNQFSVNLGFFQNERKNKTFFSCLVICPVDGFFILFTHVLQSWFVNTANQHNYHLPFHFHQEVGILRLYTLVYVLIFFFKLTSFYQTIMNLTFQI